MRITNTELPGVKILHFDRKEDARGSMVVTLNEKDMEEEGIYFRCKEQRVYTMPQKGTFFGIHFQSGKHPQDKMIHLLAGRGIDYAIDLQKESPTYQKWVAIELQGGDSQYVYIPQGYGHAFLSLENQTVQLFAVNEYFYKGEAGKVRFDDPQIGLKLPIEIVVMSDGDRDAPYSTERRSILQETSDMINM